MRRGGIGHPINLVLNRFPEYFPWMFRGTICCSGFAWDRSTTLSVVSQELSQNYFSCSPSKKGFWSVASPRKLSLKLRVNKSSDTNVELVMELLHLSIHSSPPRWASCPELVLQSFPCCRGQNYSVQNIPSRCSSQCECALATSSKPESQPWSGWGRVSQQSEARRYRLESGAAWEKGSWVDRGSAVLSPSRWGVQGVEQRSGKLWIALSEPDVLHSWLWQPQWRVQGRCRHRWTWWMEAVFAL